MAIIPFGPWRPDARGLNIPVTTLLKNARPAPNGFAPVGALASGTDALPAQCAGAASGIATDGSGVTAAGTATKLYTLQADNSWSDATRLTGGDYSTAAGNRWRFIQFTNVDTVGDLLIATNESDDLQKLDLAAFLAGPSTARFQALGGTPPPARFMATGFNAFLILGHTTGGSGVSNRVQWCDVQNPEQWDPAAPGSRAGFQDAVAGGPVTGLLSGEIVYVFQRNRITRMIYVPGSSLVMQFDEVESGRGLLASNSLIEVGDEAFYYGIDGFYQFSKRAGRSIPIGANKINEFFATDIRTGTEGQMLGGADPVQTLAFWSYISKDTGGGVPDKALIYDWSLQEWGRAEISITAISQFISRGYNLDNIDGFGSLDTLPFGLDSPFWAAGAILLGVYGTDNRLANLGGLPLEAQIDGRELSDPETQGRAYIDRVRPIVDTGAAQVAVAMREQLGDAITFSTPAGREADGMCPIGLEGRYARGRMQIPEGEEWSLAQGFDPIVETAGEQ